MAADPRAPVPVSLSIGINPEFFRASRRLCDSRRENGRSSGAESLPEGRVWA